ncbi:hypothetical protein D3C86_879820 [compost metagenome]
MITDKEKVEVYEALMHSIQMHSAVTMNSEGFGKLIDLVNSWSYAHRQGNGELSNEDQQELIDRAFNRIKKEVKP